MALKCQPKPPPLETMPIYDSLALSNKETDLLFTESSYQWPPACAVCWAEDSITPLPRPTPLTRADGHAAPNNVLPAFGIRSPSGRTSVKERIRPLFPWPVASRSDRALPSARGWPTSISRQRTGPLMLASARRSYIVAASGYAPAGCTAPLARDCLLDQGNSGRSISLKPFDQFSPPYLDAVSYLRLPFAPLYRCFPDAKVTKMFTFIIVYTKLDAVVTQVHGNLESFYANLHTTYLG